MGGKARTPFTLKPFVNIQPSDDKPPESPDLLKKLQEIDKAIEDAKAKKAEFSNIASELKDMNHPEAQGAADSVKEADKILTNLMALRHEILDGK